MEESTPESKRHIPVAALVVMLCLGGIALAFSKVKGKIKAKIQAEGKEP